MDSETKAELDARVEKAILSALSPDDYGGEQAVKDIVFHLTDWANDLEAWNEFVKAPDEMEPAQVEKLIIKFLIHVPPHLAAASRLAVGYPVTDVFGVGAVSEGAKDEGDF